MTAEFGEIICFIPLANCNKNNGLLGFDWALAALFLVAGEGRLFPMEHLNVAQEFNEKQQIL